MDINIRIKKNYIDVYLGGDIGIAPMRLLVKVRVDSNRCKAFHIEDIWGGGEKDIKYHRKGVGTAMMYYFLSYIKSEYGEKTVITRTEIHDDSADTKPAKISRRSFWDKFSLHTSCSSTVGCSLASMLTNKIEVDKSKYILARTYVLDS